MKAIEMPAKPSSTAKDSQRDYQVRRIFSVAEAQEIKELQKGAAVFRDNYPGYEKWIEMALEEVVKGRRVAFGAFKPVLDKDSKPTVKLVGSMIVKEEKYGAGVELKNLFVGEEFRRQKCGTALENAVEKHYAKKRYRVIKTEVPAKEKGTISFLLDCGYRVLITKESAHKAGDYVTEMQKELPLKYGGDYYDRTDFFHWLLSNIYNLSAIDRAGNYLTFSLEPKHKIQGDASATAIGVLMVAEEQMDVNTKVVQDFLAKHSGAHIKMLFGRNVSPEAKAECDKQGIMVFDGSSILKQFGDCFAYKPPEFKIEEIAGTVVVVNGDYIERMHAVNPDQPFTYFKGGTVGKYLKPKNKVLFFFTSSQKCPESAVLAFAEVVSVHDESPDKVWSAYESHNPLFSKEEYKTFVENKQTILAIECTNLMWIKAISHRQLCSIVGEEDLDVDDIGHLYLSAKMLLDFQDKKVAETRSNKLAQKAETEFKPSFGIITALPIECASVGCMLTNSQKITQKGGLYIIGEIPSSNGRKHSVVVALVDAGTTLAAARATALLDRFPSIDSLIMVGIAGGVPNVQKPSDHVRLGDIVVSNEGGFVQYDFVKEETNQVVDRHPPRPPSAKLLQAVKFLEAEALQGKRPWEQYIKLGMDCMKPKIAHPDEAKDVLVSSDDDKQELKHPLDKSRVIGQPRVFLGPIASSNTLLKNPKKRDFLRDEFHVKAVEMEAAGVADAGWDKNVGVLVIRGICDYCDSKKGDEWQPYAAVVAAAYTRALIESIPV
jgi:nucleoside phosphorylase/GNAT superfamily N-acetyltransferase